MPDLRVVFMGTAELACASLEALCRAPGLRVVAVVTQPDKPKGRELKLQPTPVKIVAVKHELPVHQPVKARTIKQRQIKPPSGEAQRNQAQDKQQDSEEHVHGGGSFCG